MAKRRNKAAAIREILGELGATAATKDVIQAAAARGVRVTPQHVYNVKATSGKPKRRAKGGKYDALLLAKRMADAMGGVDKARAALDVLAKLV